MANSPTSIHVAQVVGITGAAFLSGGIFAFSYAFVPVLLDAPDSLMVRQWRTGYNQGIKAAPLLSLISTSSFCFLSFKLVKTLNQGKGEMYALAALSTFSIIPYTLLAMTSTNKKLMSKAAQVDAEETNEEVSSSKAQSEKGESASELVARWKLLNYGRGLLPLVGSFLGLYTTLV